jgi:CRP-like cAMP-binding protein
MPLALQTLALVTPYHLRETIYDWHAPHEYWYGIVSGAARTCAMSTEGRRQILEFLLPGDLFGFDLSLSERVVADAVVEGTLVARYPRRSLESLAESDPRVSRELRLMVFGAIARLQERIVILGRATARAKVAAFLLEMSRRSAQQRRDQVELPMSRYDIADYLALAVETVSRTLTELKRSGIITLLSKRQVCIINRAQLEAEVHEAGQV